VFHPMSTAWSKNVGSAAHFGFIVETLYFSVVLLLVSCYSGQLLNLSFIPYKTY